jgi:hypothetical protein
MRITLMLAVLTSAIALAPLALADSGEQSVAEQAVRQVYEQRQKACTPDTLPEFKGIAWDSFYPAAAGEGRIIDTNASLGGPFKAIWTNPRVGPAQSFSDYIAVGQRAVELEFC